jgi:hypothetical protein
MVADYNRDAAGSGVARKDSVQAPVGVCFDSCNGYAGRFCEKHAASWYACHAYLLTALEFRN